jgi:thioredoxin reductase (NADPH)
MDWKDVDLLIIGGGPAGVAASIYAGGYGLNTVVIEPSERDIVGRAGTSPHLENCPGFQYGISGPELSYKLRAQATKMGACFIRARVTDLHSHIAYLDSGEKYRGRAVLIATGRTPKKLNVEGAEQFFGSGVFHEPPVLARDLSHKTFCVVGGGNPAGQVAGWLRRARGARVHLVMPESSLTAPAGYGMSHYLSKRLATADNVFIHTQSKVVSVLGDEKVNGVVIQRGESHFSTLAVDEVYAFIGSTPNTDWIKTDRSEPLALNENGTIAIKRSIGGAKYRWSWERSAFPSETSHIGVFAAGDVCVDGHGTILGAYGHAAAALQDICAYLRL